MRRPLPTILLLSLSLLAGACDAQPGGGEPTPEGKAAFAAFAATVKHNRVDRGFDKSIAALIRADRLDEAERRLRTLIEGAPPSDLKAAILATSAGDLGFSGWSEVAERLADPRITAIGFDLSSHMAESLKEGDALPLEVSYYSDGRDRRGHRGFRFSTADRAAILARSEHVTEWQGAFLDVDTRLEVDGLTPLMIAIRDHPKPDWPKQAPEQAAILGLAHWWAELVFNQAFAKEAARRSLPRRVPLILGQHSFGPSITTVYYPGG